MRYSSFKAPVLGRLSIRSVLSALLILSVQPVFADSWSGAVEVLSVGSVKDRVLWTLRPGVSLQGDSSLAPSSRWSVAGEGRLRYDRQLPFLRSKSSWDARIDRATLRWQGESNSLTAGLQKITWGDFGSFDGVDQLNPRDLSELVYANDELRKLALPALNFQWLTDNRVFQVVMTAQTEGSPLPQEREGLRVARAHSVDSRPPLELGVKAGGLLKSGWDLNGYVLSHVEQTPQFVLTSAPQGEGIEAFEPRVLTLGVTGTQTVGDFVVRSEVAFHSSRALPSFVQNAGVVADQAVLNLSSDVTLFDDFLLSSQYHGETWLAPSRSDFKNKNGLVGFGVQKPFWNRNVETSLSVLISPDGTESLFSGKASLKMMDSGQFALEIYDAKTSTGRALGRRGLQDLVVSHFSYLF
jgi:hypothetical protein